MSYDPNLPPPPSAAVPPTPAPTEGAPWQRSGYPIPVTTAFEFPEYPDVATIGPVSGVYATSLGFGRSLSAGFSSMSRGEVVDMTNLLAEARHVTLMRAVQHAQALGANGLIGVRFDSNEVSTGGIIEIHCYGTAVLLG